MGEGRDSSSNASTLLIVAVILGMVGLAALFVARRHSASQALTANEPERTVRGAAGLPGLICVLVRLFELPVLSEST